MTTLFSAVDRLGWRLQLGALRPIEPWILLAMQARVSLLPQLFMDFQRVADSCVSVDEQKWFFTAADYLLSEEEEQFDWRFLEREISLASALYEPKSSTLIREFWDQHLPIGLNVSSDYEYIAIRRDGVIVLGRAPELEDPTPLAASYEELWLLISGRASDLTTTQEAFLSDWSNAIT